MNTLDYFQKSGLHETVRAGLQQRDRKMCATQFGCHTESAPMKNTKRDD